MRKVNVIRHLAFEDLGSFEQVFSESGLDLVYHEAGVDDLAALDCDDDLLVVLGGPISANDVDDFPFLAREIDLLRERIMQDRPTLGICLGAQLIARAAGASVFPGEQKEIGWSALQLTAAGADSPLAEMAAADNMVLHWHGETFDLPEHASLLASTEITPHQAFSLGSKVMALQFHIEVTATGLERWFIGHIGEIAQTPQVSVSSLRQQTRTCAQRSAAAGQAFARAWLASITQ